MNSVTIMSRRGFRGAMLSVFVGLVFSVNAAETQTPPKPWDEGKTVIARRTVRYSDLNLSVQSDVVRLYQRIDRAARSVCGGRMQPLALQSPRQSQCRAKALADAVYDVGSPMLTAHFEGKRDEGQRAAALKKYAKASAADES